MVRRKQPRDLDHGYLVRIHLHAFLAFPLLLSAVFGQLSSPATFDEAKVALRGSVYHDQSRNSGVGSAYCGCDWEWVGRSGGRIDTRSCGLQVRADAERAMRLEWEHVVPAHSFGQQRKCWQEGGRKRCVADDPVFRMMEADMHNLVPSAGELNADRSNFRFGLLPATPKRHGACDFKVDFKARIVEPRDDVKGMFARIYFYMHDRYDLRMSDQQQRLLMAWDKKYPATAWELERDRRIARIVGHSNPFVVGTRQWTRGHRNTADGIVTPIPAGHRSLRPSSSAQGAPKATHSTPVGAVLGNRGSKVYHLPQGCPGYESVSAKNRVHFENEAKARAAGFRKAGNCR
ncbi:endonuclease [Steroidobacter agaridevorans]|uniref:endonuclease n=1 Tax=Steroidobacter agaridevorans TaxID=2695856 RepID=UPI00137A1DA9|nr:endonuclease [Steroidobacter agaridevorans]